jgi:hypothetical protein
VECAEEIAGTEISPMRNVSAAVTAPEPTVLRYTRRVVATPVVAAVEATDMKRTNRTKLPLAPDVKALKNSVPTVPAPFEAGSAAVVVSVTRPIFGVRVKSGEVLAGINQ